MFNEKNLPRLIILTPIFTIIVLIVLIVYFFTKTQQDYFLQESTQLEKEYMEKQKIILKEEINNIFNYIKYHKNLMVANIKKNMEFQINTFSRQIAKQKLYHQDYKKYIEYKYTNQKY